ncbi:MAG: argininosuccinate lyase [bacterium]|nr:argininosuccinate lyase [bacterium]
MNPVRSRFTKKLNKEVESFTSSIDVDKRLYPYDIAGSQSHVRMLAKCGIVSPKEAEQIISGLEGIKTDIESGSFKFNDELEDIHIHIEQALIERIGETGRKIHTARSRNDQVALDTRLYLREEITNLIKLLHTLQERILKKAEANLEVIMPGYTHLQHAEPVLFSHHLMAYFWMLARDVERLKDCSKRVNIMPLGACALAGSSLPIDRQYVAQLLEFPQVSENSIDTVSDRDYIVEFVNAACLIMTHISRLSEELILWSTQEFGFIELDEEFTTGSSIMPQKKNPDVCELVRGKTGRIYGHLFHLLTMMKALPLSYNRDMQEDKYPLFDTVETVKSTLSIFADLISSMEIKKERMEESLTGDFSTATELANYLVRKGIPFRKAHKIVGKICLVGKPLEELTILELQQFSSVFEADVCPILAPQESIKQKTSDGGTGLAQVRKQIETAKCL